MCAEACREEKMLISSVTGVIDSCNLHDVGARSRTHVLCKHQVLLTAEPYFHSHFYQS